MILFYHYFQQKVFCLFNAKEEILIVFFLFLELNKDLKIPILKELYDFPLNELYMLTHFLISTLD